MTIPDLYIVEMTFSVALPGMLYTFLYLTGHVKPGSSNIYTCIRRNETFIRAVLLSTEFNSPPNLVRDKLEIREFTLPGPGPR